MGACEAAHSSGQARWRPASCRRARACQRPEVYPEHRLAVAGDSCGSAAALEATIVSICGAGMARSIASTMRFMRSAAKPPRARPARPPRSLTARASRGRKRGPAIDPTGYDAGKKIKGKKWHILVDTQGLLMHAIVHAAGILDRDGWALLRATLFGAFPFLIKLYADGDQQGPEFQSAIKRILARVHIEIVKRSGQATGFAALPSAGSSNAYSPGPAAADDGPRTGNASTTRRSPQSVSCCEDYPIPHDVLGQTLRDDAGRKRGRSARPTNPAAPLSESPNHEYLSDSEGRPLFRVGDSGHRGGGLGVRQGGEAQIYFLTARHRDRVGVAEPQFRECEVGSSVAIQKRRRSLRSRLIQQ